MDKKNNEEALIHAMEKISERTSKHCKDPNTHKIEIQANRIGSRSLLGLGSKSNIIMQGLRSKKLLTENPILVDLDIQSSSFLYGPSKRLIKTKKKEVNDENRPIEYRKI